jgi:hypothetical protein
MTRPLRVVQWTKGNVCFRAARAVTRLPHIELVGCFAWSHDKVGRDVGVIIVFHPIGVAATDDIDAMLTRARRMADISPTSGQSGL